jgi:hypothetical protein
MACPPAACFGDSDATGLNQLIVKECTQQGIFCFKFIEGVKAAFKSKYPLLGESVSEGTGSKSLGTIHAGRVGRVPPDNRLSDGTAARA